jgi:type IV secretory pathway TraG/TraD family ATPase VirD4
MTGTVTIEKANFSFSGSRVSPVMDHITASVQQIERPLMTPDEVMRIQLAKKAGDGANERIVAPGEMLIFVSGHPPILGTQILYFMDPAFAQHVTIRPPLHLKAIEEGKAVPQRALDRTRHRLSRPERDRSEDEREPKPPAPNATGQPAPPPATFHDELAILQNPHYQPYVGPPVFAREAHSTATPEL